MKRRTFVLGAVLGLAGCGGVPAPTPTPANTPTPSPPPIEIGISNVVWKEGRGGKEAFGTLSLTVRLTNKSGATISTSLGSLEIKASDGKEYSANGFIHLSSSAGIAPGETIGGDINFAIKGTVTAQELTFTPLGESRPIASIPFPQYSH